MYFHARMSDIGGVGAEWQPEVLDMRVVKSLVCDDHQLCEYSLRLARSITYRCLYLQAVSYHPISRIVAYSLNSCPVV